MGRPASQRGRAAAQSRHRPGLGHAADRGPLHLRRDPPRHRLPLPPPSLGRRSRSTSRSSRSTSCAEALILGRAALSTAPVDDAPQGADDGAAGVQALDLGEGAHRFRVPGGDRGAEGEEAVALRPAGRRGDRAHGADGAAPNADPHLADLGTCRTHQQRLAAGQRPRPHRGGIQPARRQVAERGAVGLDERAASVRAGRSRSSRAGQRPPATSLSAPAALPGRAAGAGCRRPRWQPAGRRSRPGRRSGSTAALADRALTTSQSSGRASVPRTAPRAAPHPDRKSPPARPPRR